MPEHLRAFVVIAVLSVMSFLVLRRPVVAMGMAEEDFRRRRNLWLAMTALAFLSSNFWIFMLIAAGLLLLFARKDRNPFALYLFLLFVVPPFAAALPGLGIVNKLFELSFPRLLALLVLLPFVLRRRDPDTPGFGKHVADWLVVGYLLLQLVLHYRADTFTNTLRTGFNAYLDVFPALLRGEPGTAQLQRHSRRAAVAGSRGPRPGADRGVRVRQALAALLRPGGSARRGLCRRALSRPRRFPSGPGHGRAFDRPRLRDGDRLAAALRPAACESAAPGLGTRPGGARRRPGGHGLARAVGRRGGRNSGDDVGQPAARPAPGSPDPGGAGGGGGGGRVALGREGRGVPAIRRQHRQR